MTQEGPLELLDKFVAELFAMVQNYPELEGWRAAVESDWLRPLHNYLNTLGQEGPQEWRAESVPDEYADGGAPYLHGVANRAVSTMRDAEQRVVAAESEAEKSNELLAFWQRAADSWAQTAKAIENRAESAEQMAAAAEKWLSPYDPSEIAWLVGYGIGDAVRHLKAVSQRAAAADRWREIAKEIVACTYEPHTEKRWYVMPGKGMAFSAAIAEARQAFDSETPALAEETK